MQYVFHYFTDYVSELCGQQIHLPWYEHRLKSGSVLYIGARYKRVLVFPPALLSLMK
jgi:hypothetical protein